MVDSGCHGNRVAGAGGGSLLLNYADLLVWQQGEGGHSKEGGHISRVGGQCVTNGCIAYKLQLSVRIYWSVAALMLLQLPLIST